MLVGSGPSRPGFEPFWTYLGPILRVLGLDLGHIGPISSVLVLDLGLLGVDFGHFGLISGGSTCRG